MVFAISDIQPSIQKALHQASQKTGVAFDYLYQKAFKESSLKANAVSKTSSATGLFQFIESTWQAMVKRYGKAYGINPDAYSKQEILEMRKDPALSSFMAAKLTQENQTYIQKKLGRAPTNGELYLAHFMGPSNAVKFIEKLQSSPHIKACDLFGDCAKTNYSIFYNSQNGEARNLKEVYHKLTAHIDTIPSHNVNKLNDPASSHHSPNPNPYPYPSPSHISRQTSSSAASLNGELIAQITPMSFSSNHSQLNAMNNTLLASDMLFELLMLRS